MKIKTVIILLAALVGITSLCGCTEKRKFRIGISQCSSDDWRSKMNEEILREAMFHDNVEVEIRSADDSNARQIADLEYFAANGFDLVAVAPNEADALTPEISRLHASGTPVIVFDRDVNGREFTAFQGADNLLLGRMAASVAASYSPNPCILEIQGLKDSSPAELRHRGFRQYADSAGFTIAAATWGNWNYEDAHRLADSLLRLHPETNIIFAHNDRMAIGASDAARALGRPDIKIIGVDAAPAIGIQAVADGKIDVTFLYPTGGHELVRTALAILQGKPYERLNIMPAAMPVDASNAEILLLQDKAMREETDKVSLLQQRMDAYSERYTRQQSALISTIVILVLFAGVIFLLMRWYWTGKRHRLQIEARNSELARQRDELDELYRQLQEATGSKLTFFTNVSHDLRTPLTLIADPVAQLAEAPNLSPQQHTLMQLANKNVKRLQRLINQILDIRKYDSGQLKLNLMNVDLAGAIREWTAPFADVAARRHIKFSTDIDCTADIHTAIDVEKTERILFNLLSNAFKFTPENGSISVSLCREGAEAVIKVADTGVGIPPEEIDLIFQRFFKTDRINPNGSGIGLALSKVFIDMHGGSISAASDAGKGTTFTVRLPIRTAPEADSKPAAAPEVPSTAMDVEEIGGIDDVEVEVAPDTPTVLVIDDNSDICTLVKCTLADNFTVLTASSGARGIRMANKYVPDLVICDVMMPGMDGYQVCRSLKQDEMTSHIPVLLLTACSRDEQRIEGYDCGADAYMSKPFDSAMLRARCRSLIENRRLVLKTAEGRPASENRKPAAPAGIETAARGLDDEFLRRFVEMVEARMANPDLSVETLAAEMGLSRVQMYRKIKAVTNYSASEMIRNIRLRRAAALLKSTEASVSEICYTVGFSSPSYFTRCYREFFNETPGETQSRTSRAR